MSCANTVIYFLKVKMNKKKGKIRIVDIAKKANVSTGTVDRVLHNRGEVNEETRKKVMQIVEEIGYTPNLLAKSLASKKTYEFAAIIPDASDSNPYWNKPLEGIQKGAAEIKDYNASVKFYTFTATEPQSYKNACESALKAKPAGIIIDPVFKDVSVEFTCKLDQEAIPYIYIDTDLEEGNCLSYFGQNAKQSGHVAAKILNRALPVNAKILIVKLANKGVISHHLHRRAEGFVEFFKEINHCACEFMTVEIDLLEEDQPFKALEAIFNENPDINGVFVPNSRVFKVAEYIHANKMNDSVTLLGYDLIEKNIENLHNGAIDFLIGQKPEEQGYKSVLTLFNYVVLNKKNQKTNYSPIDIIIKENIEFYQ